MTRGLPDRPGPSRRTAEGPASRRLAVMISTYFEESRFIERELRGLRERGVTLEVFALRSRSEAVREVTVLPFLWSGEVWRRNLRWLLRRPGRYLRTILEIAGSHLGSPRVLAKSLGVFPKAAAYADRIREQGFRRVHAHWAGLGASAAWIVHRLAGTPYSFTGHAWDLYFDTQMLGRKIADASCVITCTAFNRHYLERTYTQAVPGKVVVSYHGLDLEQYAYRDPGPVGRPARLLAVGKRTAKKGFEDLVRACGLLARRGVELELRIIGWPGDSDRRLRETIASEQLDGAVAILGPQDEAALIQSYRESDLLAVPSVIVDQRLMDGIPNVLLEAMALGLPVVATSVSGIPEIVVDGETGRLVPPGTPESLADAIAESIEEPERRRSRSRRARSRIEQEFDLRRNAERLEQLLLSP